MFDNLQLAVDEYQLAKDKALKAFKQELKPALKAFMAAHPEILYIHFVQYTPYFNDGDPCVFGMGDLTAQLKSADGSDPNPSEDMYYEDDNTLYAYGDKHPISLELAKLTNIMNHNKEIMEAIFGDHAHVIITADSITVEEYNHD